MERTDWDAYYKKISLPAKITRKITQNLILDLLYRHHVDIKSRIAEPGGAHSCFFKAINTAFSPSVYTIIDTNKSGIDLFLHENTNISAVQAYQKDILSLQGLSDLKATFDCVLSVGLIEHFDSHDTAQAIASHFYLARPQGLVLLFFPTPDILYRVSRYILEVIGVWKFPDERPLPMQEILQCVSQYGEVLESGINSKILLSQGYLIAQKYS